MNKIFQALKFAIIVCVLIHIIGLSIAIYISGLEATIADLKLTVPITISHFIFPCFLAVYFYEKDMLTNFSKGIKIVFKSGLSAFLILYIVVYFTLKINKEIDIPFWNIASFFSGIVAAFISIFSLLIYYLLNSKSDKKTIKNDFEIPLRIVLLFSLLISATYVFLLYILGSNMLSVKSVFKMVFNGFIASGLVYIVLNIIKSKTLSKLKENALIVFVYIFNSFVLPFLFFILFVPSGFEIKAVKIFQSILIIGPYYLMSTLVIHVYYIYLLNRFQKETLTQSTIASNLKYQQLKTQLSPHFLFNNISILTSLIEENPKQAAEFSEKLSTVYRYFLDHENQELVLLEDELSFGKAYMDLLKVRFENALQVAFKLENTSDYYILPLALQQVFENIIKHNEVTEMCPMNVTVISNNSYLIIENTLNLKAIDNSKPQTGLENIKKRYSYFTNRLIIVNVNSNSYQIKLPLLKVEK